MRASICLALAFLSSGATAASFDCTKAATLDDRSVCAKQQPSVDAALLTAARKVVPGDLAERELQQSLKAGLWHESPAAVAITIPRGNQYMTFVFRRQPDGTWSAADASWVARTAFGFWGFRSEEIQRFETRPMSWRFNEERNLLFVNIRTRGWRNGQRYTAQQDFLVAPDGTVSGQ